MTAVVEVAAASGLPLLAPEELDPENAELFTWWPPWRSMRQRNIGWRLDYVFASAALAWPALAQSQAAIDALIARISDGIAAIHTQAEDDAARTLAGCSSESMS